MSVYGCRAPESNQSKVGNFQKGVKNVDVKFTTVRLLAWNHPPTDIFG